MNRNALGYLDSLWLGHGAERLKHVFRALAAKDKGRALRLVNETSLLFPTLFILMPEIESMSLTGLSPRNLEAIRICTLRAGKPGQRPQNSSPAEFETLKWMLETGIDWDGPQEQYDAYDAVIDACAALLIKKYKYTSILPQVCDLIFRRNRKGLFIHDLVWSFFEAHDPDSLRLTARYLLSPDERDYELACKLLHLPASENSYGARQALYENFISWLNENSPYLLFTGQHFQQTSEPEPLVVDDEARYLGKRISPKSGKPLEPLTKDEVLTLLNYRKAPNDERRLLSSFSAKIRGRDRRMWQQWLHGDLAQQVSIAKSEWEAV
ncbi:MAG: hypothetical protein GX250_02250 [Clostridiales bacterium]|nr:hypothetical protein [Clostridiales bacterium]